ncbi:Metallo-hydrolase/oxidoreductase [Yamadazyma tenuis ATCC 10573]|uniref:Endoribonuclease YSH1 n=1 Tax=Candida tenuis (strain ATCC 10573 / BCRC 21748 / CBS 615 / JCM 9827 / NBRC 10315 / NRRL Y-1498 / VKM Y-70) TaxID=590646 RepID=G3B2A7_CANTC|nr:Metallo-hydrolase/oxidoreductase [Yamadazyma tenuis ATCC 10573]EGV64631.1 Metallo-hydrolase/oxidoreductase [Yamadazyma tenuis ATCC 10573]
MATVDSTDDFKFTGLGGCNEVGRSCHIIEYKNKVIMLDAGVHPGLSGLNSLPFYDEYDLSKVDLLLVSHFHLDHAASLPYVMQHTNFRGRVFMTHATKAIYRWLLTDFVRVTSLSSNTSNDPNSGGTSANLYTDEDLMKSFDRIETVDFHSTMELDGIRFTAYHAGHVLGACLYLIEIGGLKALFTGDYSREENRHLPVAEVPSVKPDILITESTFGTATHEPRMEKENRMTRIIHSTLSKGGRVLMPVFALGTAQELLLILEEYWSQNKDLQNIDVYFASSLARKCLAVYQTYTNIMNDKIRSMASSSSYDRKNPFTFKYIKTLKSLDRFQDFGPSVVIASPGMLQSGFSRQLLEKWAPDPKNTVLMTGYSVEGTMAKDLLIEPPTIPSVNNPEMTITRRLSIEEISFAAHVDFQQNAEFIGEVNAPRIILVHGDSIPMGRLKSALLSKYANRKGTDQEVKVFNPRNGDELKIAIKGLKVAKVLGALAEEQIGAEEEEEEKDEDMKDTTEEKENGNKTEDSENHEDDKQEDDDFEVFKSKQVLSGVIVSKDFDLNIVQLQDLHEYSQLATSIVKSKIDLIINAHISLIEWHLQQMFGYINVANDDEDEWECVIMDIISILIDRSKSKGSSNYVTVEWVNDNLMADSLADSVVAILYSIDSSPASVKISSSSHSHDHEKPVKKEEDSNGNTEITIEKSGHMNTDINDRKYRISTLLKAQFGDALKGNDMTNAQIAFGKNEATINYNSLTVTCNSKVLKDRIENIIKRACGLAAPLSQFEKSV